MGITLFQNSSKPKYRVSRKIQGRDVQRYFDRTPVGLKAAEVEDRRLQERQRQAQKSGPGGSYHHAEYGNKLFHTGVMNISLYHDHKTHPTFKLHALGRDGLICSLSRSISRHGYAKAWRECCDRLWALYQIDEPIPPPPSVARARKYLRSCGVAEDRILNVTLGDN